MKSFLSSLLDKVFGKKEEKQPALPKLEQPKLEEPKLEEPKLELPPPELVKAEPNKDLKPSSKTKPQPEKPKPYLPPAKTAPSNPKSSNIPPPAKKPAQQPQKPIAKLSSRIDFVNNNFSKLTDQDFLDAASILGCEVAVIRAVVEVESSGGGFFPSNRPKILFEAHLFARHTKHLYNKSHPTISSQVWNKTLYQGGEKEYLRLEEALKLDESAALASCSYGMFQILASNFKSCGFNSIEEFVEAQIKGEKEQLASFIQFVQANKLDVHLRSLNFPLFARMYNGPSYQSNKYDIKLQKSYEKWKQK